MSTSRASSSAAETAAVSGSRTRTVERVRLSGPSVKIDTRINPVRPDLVDVRLAGQVMAAHYATAIDRICTAVVVPIRAGSNVEASAVSELLMGECFELLDVSGDWAWGCSAHDSYVGYVPRTALAPPGRPATHIVATAAALVFKAANIKSPVCARWPLGARFAGDPQGDFLLTSEGYVHCRHALALGDHSDAVEIAERLVGVPYRWGGRSGDGIDCSGLVQTALAFAGVVAPRDSDQQRALGQDVPAGAPLERGDLIFFPGHVGLMVDGERMIHANAYWMQVIVEPLADVVARLKTTIEQPVLARRRLA